MRRNTGTGKRGSLAQVQEHRNTRVMGSYTDTQERMSHGLKLKNTENTNSQVSGSGTGTHESLAQVQRHMSHGLQHRNRNRSVTGSSTGTHRGIIEEMNYEHQEIRISNAETRKQH